MVGGVAGLIGTYICGPRLGILGKHMQSSWKSVPTTEERASEMDRRESISSECDQRSPKITFALKEKILFENSSGIPMPERIRIFK
jgi:hypothetical protein